MMVDLAFGLNYSFPLFNYSAGKTSSQTVLRNSDKTEQDTQTEGKGEAEQATPTESLTGETEVRKVFSDDNADQARTSRELGSA